MDERSSSDPGRGRRRSPRRAPSGCDAVSWDRPRWRRGCARYARRPSGRRPRASRPSGRSISASRDSTRPARSARVEQEDELVGGDGASPRRRLAPRGRPCRSRADRSAASRLLRGRALAAQDGAQAGLQLARLEGLGEIIVGADLEPDHAVHRFAARRQHQDRHVGRARRRRQRSRPSASGSMRSRITASKASRFRQRLALAPGGGDRHTKARPAEIVGDHPGEAVVVVDHQDALGHRLSIGPGDPDVTCRG